MANSTIPNLVAVSVPALTDLFGVRQSGDTRDKKLTVTQLLTLIPGGGDVTKVGTPVDDQLGVWTGDGTIEGVPTLRYNSSLELFADSIVLGDLESVKIRETTVNTIAFRFSNFDRWRMNNDSFASSVSDGAFLKRTGVSLTVPSLVPRSGDENTGIGSTANDDLSIIAGGVLAIRVTESVGAITMLLGGKTTGTGANAFGLINEVASATNPTLLPNRADEDSGIGQNAADQVSIIGGGVELARFTEVTNANQFAIVASGNSAIPDLTGLADPDTGFRWTGGNQVVFIGGGTAAWNFLSTSFFASASDGPILFNTFGSATVPSICVERGDPDTGFGRGANDAISLICGGVEGLRLTEASLGVIQVPEAGLAITAFATGGQVGATQLNSSYNVIGTVATTGDSVKLLPTFAVNSIIFIKNDGANAADVFPGIGDDLGAGTDTAISLAAGESASFIATVANLTWTPWIVSVGGGGGDVTKVGTPANDQIGVWTGDGTIEGDDQFLWDGSALTVGFTNAGPQLLNEVASETNPTIVPTRNDTDTGIGHDAADRMAIIAGGVTVAHVQESSGAPAFIIDPNDAGSGAPELGFGPGGDTGFRESADVITLILGSASKWGWDANLYVSITATGAGLKNEVVSATNPTFVPNRSDLNSGIGQNAVDQVSIIAGGIEIARAVEDTVEQFIISPGALLGTAALPSLAFGDGDTGFRESFADTIKVGLAGVDRWTFTEDRFVAVAGNGPSLQNEASTGTNPTLIPALGDVSTGIGGITTNLSLIVGGVERLKLNTALSNGNVFTGDWVASNGTGPIIQDEAATGTNPTLVPHQSDQDTGIGRSVADELSLIAGGVQIAQAKEASGANQFIIAPGVVQNAAATPSLAFGDGNTGFFESIDNTLKVSVGNAARWQFQANNFLAENSAGPFMFNTAGTSSSVPIMGPNRGDNNTGIGHGSDDQLDFICGGLNCITIRELGAARQIGFYNATPVSQQTGVAVSSAGIHAALVSLGLITA